MATYLSLVNNVLKRLRENTVGTVAGTTYTAMIGVLVNDAKREVEDAHDWNCLNSVIPVSTVAGTEEYTLTGSGQRFRVKSVYNDTSDIEMRYRSTKYFNNAKYIGNAQSASPSFFNFTGVNGSGDTKVTVYPTPDDVYSLKFDLTIPQVDLSADGDTLSVPSYLVELLAYSKAIAERGEDGGVQSSEAYAQYRLALADAVAIERNRYDEDVSWESV